MAESKYVRKSSKAYRTNAVEWWKRKLFGLAPGSLRNRKKKVDKDIKKSGG